MKGELITLKGGQEAKIEAVLTYKEYENETFF